MSPQTISLSINKFIIYFSFLLSHPKDVHALLTEINKNFKNAIGVAALQKHIKNDQKHYISINVKKSLRFTLLMD